jgi:hypothetical protein
MAKQGANKTATGGDHFSLMPYLVLPAPIRIINCMYQYSAKIQINIRFIPGISFIACGWVFTKDIFNVKTL